MALVLASATQAGAAHRLNCSSHVSHRANYKTPRGESNRQNEKFRAGAPGQKFNTPLYTLARGD
jgi:hypothetical protein